MIQVRDFIKNYAKSWTVTTVLLIILFFLTNWLSYGFYIRFDLSRTGRFRLSSATKDILRNLPDKVTLEAFFSSEVPNVYIHHAKLSRDFLREYASASRGKVRIAFIDPDSDESSLARARALKIPQARISVRGKSELEVKRIYLAVSLSYGDKREIIQSVVNTRFLEYELTSKIYRMVYPGERGIGILSGQGNIALKGRSAIESLEAVSNGLKPFYGEFKEINTSEGDIPSDITTLFVIGPSQLQPIDKFRIDQFIMRGGSVIFSVSGMSADLSSGRVIPTSQSVLDFISTYGFTIGSDMLFEPKNHVPIRNPAPGNPHLVQTNPYPVWIVSQEDSLNQDHITTRGVPGLFFPWTSSIKINEDKLLPPDSNRGSGEKNETNATNATNATKEKSTLR